jgi:hypothetical protein
MKKPNPPSDLAKSSLGYRAAIKRNTATETVTMAVASADHQAHRLPRTNPTITEVLDNPRAEKIVVSQIRVPKKGITF